MRVEEHPHRPDRADLLPRLHRRRHPALADPRDLAQARARVGVDDLQHLGAVAVEQELRPERPDVLDRRQDPQQRVLAHRLAQPHRLGHELAPEALVLAPAAAQLDRLALVDVAQRARRPHRVALVGDALQHRELAVRRPPADPRHLDHQLLGHGHAGDGRPRSGGDRGSDAKL